LQWDIAKLHDQEALSHFTKGNKVDSMQGQVAVGGQLRHLAGRQA